MVFVVVLFGLWALLGVTFSICVLGAFAFGVCRVGMVLRLAYRLTCVG